MLCKEMEHGVVAAGVAITSVSLIPGSAQMGKVHILLYLVVAYIGL